MHPRPGCRAPYTAAEQLTYEHNAGIQRGSVPPTAQALRWAGPISGLGLDLTLPPLRITAVVGASGCGKSTLLQLINGLLRPDVGEVRVFGQPLDYRDLPRLRRRIGYAVQQIGLFPHLTVRDNIAILAEREQWQRSRLRARIEQLLDMMDLAPALLGRYPHEISGGQAQRVELCRAMMLEPPLLLLDEAFSAVDPITRAEVHARFQALQRAEPRTVVLVTHDAVRPCGWRITLPGGDGARERADRAIP